MRDLTINPEETLKGTDKTGQAPYSMANKGGSKATQKLPSQFKRENDPRYL